MLTVVARVLTSQTANIKRKPAIAAGTSRSERMRAHPITWWLKLGAAHEKRRKLENLFRQASLHFPSPAARAQLAEHWRIYCRPCLVRLAPAVVGKFDGSLRLRQPKDWEISKRLTVNWIQLAQLGTIPSFKWFYEYYYVMNIESLLNIKTPEWIHEY